MTEREARTDDVSTAAPALTRAPAPLLGRRGNGERIARGAAAPVDGTHIEGGAFTGATAFAFITVLADLVLTERETANDDAAAAPVTERASTWPRRRRPSPRRASTTWPRRR